MIPRHRNRTLFSNHYIEDLLPKQPEWQIDTESVFDKIKALWDSRRDSLQSYNEDQLRKHFLDKIFEFLGFAIDVEPPATGGGTTRNPDYALFKDDAALSAARKNIKKGGYFETALCISEAKRWGRPLDNKLQTERDLFEIQNPSLQMSNYLWLTGVKWGILTDGRFWRLYEREKSKKLDIYYEVDLEDIILYGTVEDFKYFYLFFRAEAFPLFIDKIFKGSTDYAKEVGDKLKGNAYKAIHVLSEGFLNSKGNSLSKDNLEEIHDNTLILLYRLLFILYAEYRGLLPIKDNALYAESHSLNALKKQIAEKTDNNASIPSTTFHYWNNLKELFEVINTGNADLGVPPYNGGLFSTEKHKFLEDNRLGDSYIAKAIDLISRTAAGDFIDYGTLEIRHLGSIYEGLLEYKVKIAEEDIYPVKENSKEIYVPLSKAKVKTIQKDKVVKKGELYLATDKGERKATGSYYTPDYIVEYIVENTLGPVIEDKKKTAEAKIEEITDKVKKTRGKPRELANKELAKATGQLIDELLSIKVLDPAMGSGHFLVEATDFIAKKLIEALGEVPTEIAEDETRWARREVVEKCIFGVDINPLAVELAKLSLWLHTVSKNRPLNFLDHHLRCGNSLIGANIGDMGSLPDPKKRKTELTGNLLEPIFNEKISLLLKDFALIEGLPSDTVEQIREKEKLYTDFRKRVSRFQIVADVWLSVYFGNEKIDYDFLLNNLRSSDNDWNKTIDQKWVNTARQIARDKHFFHWELEFPEIFYEGHLRKDDPGFDCVIGNPPYGIARERDYIKIAYRATAKNLDMYSAFTERALHLLRITGYHGYIIPVSWQTGSLFISLRAHLLSNYSFRKIVNLPFDVFKDAYIDTCVTVVRNIAPKEEAGPVLVFEYPKKSKIEELQGINYLQVNQDSWLAHNMQIILSESTISLISRINSLGVDTLGAITESARGILAKPHHIVTVKEQGTKPFFDGEMFRYECADPTKHILYSNDLPECPSSFEFFEGLRLLVRRLVSRKNRLMSHAVTNTFVHKKDIYIFKIKNELSTYYLLALLNSRLFSYLYLSQDVVAQKDDFRQTTLDGLRKLPILRIESSSHESHRAKFISKASKDSSNLEKVIKLIEIELKDNRSDTIHDLLSHLAEQMIEMNKKKNEEINGFLTWLQRELGVEIDTLANKTYINAYHEYAFDHLLDILKKNKKKIAIDPSGRKAQETLEKHFNESATILSPLKEKIRATDDLIDQIVYKLYGLTDEEIKIVEEKVG